MKTTKSIQSICNDKEEYKLMSSAINNIVNKKGCEIFQYIFHEKISYNQFALKRLFLIGNINEFVKIIDLHLNSQDSETANKLIGSVIKNEFQTYFIIEESKNGKDRYFDFTHEKLNNEIKDRHILEKILSV
jgi:hypothetical protein